MGKVSFVIPAHNAAGTIGRSVRSIVGLGMDSEVLIVENGSTDKTLETAGALAGRYAGVRVLQSEKGVSRARNKGIGEATGEWIVFVDADDECLPGLKEVCGMPRASTADPLDIIVCSYKKDGDPIIHDYKAINSVIDISDGLKAWMISRPTLRMQAWAKVFRTGFLRARHLRFNEGLSYSEDSEFLIRALLKARRALVSDKVAYQYHSGTASAMRGYKEGRIQEYLKALEEAGRDVEGSSGAIKDAFLDYAIAHINIMAVHDIFACEIKMPWKCRVTKMKEVLREKMVKEYIGRVGWKYIKSPRNWAALCFKHGLVSVWGGIAYARSLQNRRRYQRAGINSDSGV